MMTPTADARPEAREMVANARVMRDRVRVMRGEISLTLGNSSAGNSSAER